jgi:hypothetical protein
MLFDGRLVFKASTNNIKDSIITLELLEDFSASAVVVKNRPNEEINDSRNTKILVLRRCFEDLFKSMALFQHLGERLQRETFQSKNKLRKVSFTL